MWREAGAEVGYSTSEIRGFPNAWRAGTVAGSCWVSRSLLEEERVCVERGTIPESSGSHIGCPLNNTEAS